MLVERTNEIDIAKELWTQTVDIFQPRYLNTNYAVNDFTTNLFYLTSKNLTTRGVGKGISLDEIDISARFEALEYYLSGYHVNQYPILFGKPSEIANDYPLFLGRCDAVQFMHSTHANTPLPWVVYTDFLSKDEMVAPLASVDLFYFANVLENDQFDYENTKVYAAGNGLASGTTFEESVIHGALELIERDAYSYFLVDTYLLNKPPQIVNKQLLPSDLMILVDNIEKNYNNQIVILKMPSRFGVYAYIATFLDKEFSIPPRGGGASLNSRYALERAVLELVQSYNLSHGNYVKSEINSKKLDNHFLIKNFLEFNLHRFLEKPNFVNFVDNSDEFRSMSLSTYLTKLVELIYKQSSLLVNEVYLSDNGLSCSRVLIPDAEEFFLATHYLMLKPKTKLHSYISEELGQPFCWDNF
jgi:YcaO-like protein with predicted kinase domain